mmetsp:Transcript_18138/g.23507  ORF Transcript_18138/g.23507 Transcript_18138/m.23507 type:complete len:85 (+) Transcript_18138:89-343(+)
MLKSPGLFISIAYQSLAVLGFSPEKIINSQWLVKKDISISTSSHDERLSIASTVDNLAKRKNDLDHCRCWWSANQKVILSPQSD